MKEPISEGKITIEEKQIATEPIGIEETKVYEKKAQYIVNLEELLDTTGEDAHWYFGVGGPA